MFLFKVLVVPWLVCHRIRRFLLSPLAGTSMLDSDRFLAVAQLTKIAQEAAVSHLVRPKRRFSPWTMDHGWWNKRDSCMHGHHMEGQARASKCQFYLPSQKMSKFYLPC
jgi:hypothetical protein